VNNFGASIQLANLLVEVGQGQRAAKYYQNSIRIKPDSTAAHFGLIISVLRHPNGSEACTQHLKEVLRHDPDNLTALTQLAMLRLLKYEDVKCARLLRRALEIDNSFAPTLVVMGELERFTGRSDMAQKYYQRAIKYDQHQQIALKGLTKICCTTGSTEEAWKHYQIVLKQNTDLAAPGSDLSNDADLKQTLTIRLRQSVPISLVKEFYFDTPWQIPMSAKPQTMLAIIQPDQVQSI